jgi:hypothetical protein
VGLKRVALALLLAGCVTNENDAPKPARTGPPPPPPPVAALPDAAPQAAAPPGKLPEKAEVEMGGTVTLPPGKTGTAEIYVQDGPCWKKESKRIARAGAAPDRWGVEIFVSQGTSFWVCAMLPEKKGKPTVHAEAGPFLGKGSGEVIFTINLKLVAGAPVDAPAP